MYRVVRTGDVARTRMTTRNASSRSRRKGKVGFSSFIFPFRAPQDDG